MTPDVPPPSVPVPSPVPVELDAYGRLPRWLTDPPRAPVVYPEEDDGEPLDDLEARYLAEEMLDWEAADLRRLRVRPRRDGLPVGKKCIPGGPRDQQLHLHVQVGMRNDIVAIAKHRRLTVSELVRRQLFLVILEHKASLKDIRWHSPAGLVAWTDPSPRADTLQGPPAPARGRDALIKLRVPSAEKAAWQSLAHFQGMGLSEWIRRQCERGARADG